MINSGTFVNTVQNVVVENGGSLTQQQWGIRQHWVRRYLVEFYREQYKQCLEPEHEQQQQQYKHEQQQGVWFFCSLR